MEEEWKPHNKVIALFDYAESVMAGFDYDYKESEWSVTIERSKVSAIKGRITEALNCGVEIPDLVRNQMREALLCIDQASKLIRNLSKPTENIPVTLFDLRNFHEFKLKLFDTFYHLCQAQEIHEQQGSKSMSRNILNEVINDGKILDDWKKHENKMPLGKDKFYQNFLENIRKVPYTELWMPKDLELHVSFSHFVEGDDPDDFMGHDKKLSHVFNVNGCNPESTLAILVNTGVFEFKFAVLDRDEMAPLDVRKELIKPGNIGCDVCLILYNRELHRIFVKNTEIRGMYRHAYNAYQEDGMVLYTITTQIIPEYDENKAPFST